MKAMRYHEPNDLFRAQAALMRWVSEAGQCHYLHKGDIGHRLFNGCCGYDKREMFRYWLDAEGEIAAFALLLPHWEYFALQVAPRLLFSPFHGAALDYCEREMLRIARLIKRPLNALALEASDCEPAMAAFLTARGYGNPETWGSLTRHDLSGLPNAALPAGFSVRRANADDAEMLADVHNHSFANKWTAESYLSVFHAPHLEYEFIVEAPDGRFAAFTNVWVDELNRSLLFEPVGTHADFRRRGIARALMVYVMKRMERERGIECAYVGHEPAAVNPASGALYRSVGFKKHSELLDYRKGVE